jgi:hypothetical protein
MSSRIPSAYEVAKYVLVLSSAREYMDELRDRVLRFVQCLSGTIMVDAALGDWRRNEME